MPNVASAPSLTVDEYAAVDTDATNVDTMRNASAPSAIASICMGDDVERAIEIERKRFGLSDFAGRPTRAIGL
jgi:hypothetical protein